MQDLCFLKYPHKESAGTRYPGGSLRPECLSCTMDFQDFRPMPAGLLSEEAVSGISMKIFHATSKYSNKTAILNGLDIRRTGKGEPAQAPPNHRPTNNEKSAAGADSSTPAPHLSQNLNNKSACFRDPGGTRCCAEISCARD